MLLFTYCSEVFRPDEFERPLVGFLYTPFVPNPAVEFFVAPTAANKVEQS